MATSAKRSKWICTSCMHAFPRWPGACCKSCGAFAGCVVSIDEARAAGVALPMSLLGADAATKASRTRYRTGLRALDRILSHEGGIVPASSVLLASCPGGGKTTLLLASSSEVSARRGRRVAYCSAEQDAASLHALAEKLGAAGRDRLLPISIRTLADVEAAFRSSPVLCIVDSATELARHTRSQPAAVVGALHEMAHDTRTTVIATAHVNAAGLVRGGPELEHATDTVLMLTGDPRTSPMRELCATKNRHGDTTLTTRLRMTASGFEDIDDTPATPRRALGIGCALALVRDADGHPQLVEVQALIASTASAPRKITTAGGISVERVRVLLDVLARDGIAPAGDVTVRVYGNPAGDPGALDAAVAGAIVSAARCTPLPSRIVLAGELALDGTVRAPAGDVEGAARSLGLRLVGRPSESIVSELSKAHLRAV